jgi:hypothetical protein
MAFEGAPASLFAISARAASSPRGSTAFRVKCRAGSGWNWSFQMVGSSRFPGVWVLGMVTSARP